MYILQLLNITGSAVECVITDALIVSYGKKISGPGKMLYRLPAASPNATAARLQKFKRVRLYRRKQDGTGNDEAVWYGYIEAHKRISDAEYEVSCAGILQLFSYRFTASNQAFTLGGSTEAFGLLTTTNGSDGNTGIVTGTGGVTNNKAIKASGYRDILSAWADLAKADTAEFEITDLGVFNFVTSLGTDKTGTSIVLRYRVDGQPGNTVQGIAEGEDGSVVRNKIIATNSGGTLTSTQQDGTSQSTYGVLVEVQVFPEAQDQPTLDAMAQARLKQVKQPATDFGANPALASRKFDVVSNGLTVTGFQYSDLVPGDLVNCEIITETQSLKGVKRIIEIQVDVDENLKETLQYTLGESGVFVSAVTSVTGAPVEVQNRLLRLEQVAIGGASGGGGGTTINFADKEVPSGTINGSNVTFTLAHTPTSGSEHVWLNGVLQQGGGGDYTLTTATIAFNVAPPSGSILLVSYRY